MYCCCGWNSFFLFRNFPLESHKKIAVFKLVLTGGGGLSLDVELFSVDNGSPALTFCGKDSFLPDIVEFLSKEKQSVVKAKRSGLQVRMRSIKDIEQLVT